MNTNWVVCFWVEKLAIAVEHRRLPDTEGEPLALVDPNGILQVVSNEAEHWGVAAGMTNQAGRGLCGDLRVFPYDRSSYEVAARPIWDLIATESNVVEPTSPEICYAETRGSQGEIIARMSRLTELAAPILDLPIRIGIARSKFVALRAAQHWMMDGPFLIPLGEEMKFLSHAPIESVMAFLPKLDLKSRKQLERLSVKTLGDVWSLSPQRLPKALQKTGYQILHLAQGFDSDPVRALWPPRKIVTLVSFTEESEDGGGSYSDGVSDLLVVENQLVKMAEAISVSLAASREYTREIGLKVGLRDGSFINETERLSMPESKVPEIYRAAIRQLQRLQIEQPIVSLELVASELGSGSGVQLSLLDAAGELPHERAKRLESAIAFLRRKYGPRVIINGALLRKARRIDLWTYSLARYMSFPLDQVSTDSDGNPVRYWRRNTSARQRHMRPDRFERQRYDVLVVHNRWRETGMRHGTLTDAEVFRVETDPYGVSDVRKLDNDWRMIASAD